MAISKFESPEFIDAAPSRFTGRAFFCGTLCTLVISVVFPYARLVLATAGLSTDYITAGAVFVFFILIALFNPLLRLCRRAWGFSAAELALVYIMMLVASAIPTWGFSALMTTPNWRRT